MIKIFEPDKDIALTAEQVRNFDNWAINTAKVPGVVLMENAGRSCAEIATEHIQTIGAKSACIFCGTGNNGGDGFVIARHFVNAGIKTQVIICGDESKISGDAMVNYKIAQNMKISIVTIKPDSSDAVDKVKTIAGDYDLIIDALFGTGLKGPLRGGYEKVVTLINSLNKDVIAVDIPSGLNCDTGNPNGAVIKAVKTVTFAAAKKGFLNPAAAEYTGKIFVASIGITASEDLKLKNEK